MALPPLDPQPLRPDPRQGSALAPGALPDAVLWDLDGTLVASEPYWMAAEAALVESFGLSWTHADGLALVGMDLLTAAQVFVDHGVPLTPPQVVEHLVGRVSELLAADVPWQLGAADLLAGVSATGVPNALVTMSYRVLAQHVVDAAPPGTFATLVCGDDVTRGKPDPEPYLLAAERLGVDITRCVAVEDSVPGIASALASGARTIAVEVMVPVPAQPGLSRVPSLASLRLGDFARIAAGETIDLLVPLGR